MVALAERHQAEQVTADPLPLDTQDEARPALDRNRSLKAVAGK
jgi:hypothetical protein